MKNILLVLSLIAVVSCGSKNDNQVNSGNPTTSGNDGLEIDQSNSVVNFEGTYDIRRDFPNANCPASIVIARGCNGYILTSNTNQKEDFCNVIEDGVVINRRPPNPDSGTPVTVTRKANELKAVVRIGQNVYTNLLTLENDTFLTKVTDYKSKRSARCLFEKR